MDNSLDYNDNSLDYNEESRERSEIRKEIREDEQIDEEEGEWGDGKILRFFYKKFKFF
jgi:hypothetical protein